ncbi:hypothetical protein [Streptomyces paludis]|uniref:Uncharacterized protein n=1 Tax=Streptomyces paludis TaxID=2282738 RepID=A0A345HWT8_9ACTN|nr:hypothetical protein [Streptomyces paludis]AXG81162.1 hypothetical protein DVK44_29620 [Streptomyces paludis]
MEITPEVIARLGKISKSVTYGYVSVQIEFHDTYAWDDPRVPWYLIGRGGNYPQQFTGAPVRDKDVPCNYKNSSGHAAIYLLGAVSAGRQERLTVEDREFLADIRSAVEPATGDAELWRKLGVQLGIGPVRGVEAGHLADLSPGASCRTH